MLLKLEENRIKKEGDNQSDLAYIMDVILTQYVSFNNNERECSKEAGFSPV